jgi:predicted ATPase/DNA-binding SARP family transcriptional activator
MVRMETLRVALLGEPRVVRGDTPVPVRAKKALALFLWLAQRGAPQSRRDAARLFWGGADEEAARTSLRTALQRLPAELAAAIEADRDQLALRGPVDLDTARFEALAASDDLESLGQAAQVYRGEFWREGESLDATPELDDWLHRERTRYRQLAQRVFDRLIARHLERAQRDRAHAAAERETAHATARRWLTLEPANETAHRWLMQLLADSGQREAALAQYEICRRELAVAHGRAPGTETQRLRESLVGADRVAGAPSPAAGQDGDDLAAQAPELPTTTFVGRVDELAELDRLMGNPACRLLTLQGLGGAGKSRLAQVVAHQHAEQHDVRVRWVALHAVGSADELLHAIARACGVDLAVRPDPAEALAAALASQRALLVLDNFEQLVEAPDAVDQILELLRRTRDVRLLVTSRQVLGVQEEWVYELAGLTCPDDDATTSQGPVPSAAELFVQRARQSYFGFSASAEWPHIVRICRMVDGLPLALELAAAWVRTVPTADIARTIELEMGSLASRHRDRPARHQGLDAVVGTAWSMLPRDQQEALAALGLFNGTFTQQAAQVVAETSLRVLSALVDKSLLQRRVDARLALHPIVAHHARRQLERRPAAMRDGQRRFAAFLGNLLQRERQRLDGPEGLDALETLHAEVANLSAAMDLWRAGVSPGLVDMAEPMTAALFALGRSRRIVEDATAWLDDATLPDGVRLTLLVQRGRAHASLSNEAASRRDFDAALGLAQRPGFEAALIMVRVHALMASFARDDLDAIARALTEIEPFEASIDRDALRFTLAYMRAAYDYLRGRFDEAVARLEHLRGEVEERGSPATLAPVLDMLAGALLLNGEAVRAEPLVARSISIHERTGNTLRLARALNVLAQVLCERPMPDPDAAAGHAKRALDIFERAGATLAASAAADTWGTALQRLGRADDARLAYQRAIRLGHGIASVEAEARTHLGLMQVDAGVLDDARAQALALLDLALSTTALPIRIEAMLVAAVVDLTERGPSPSNQGALRRIADEPTASAFMRRQARDRLADDQASPVADVDAWLAEAAGRWSRG